jgi:hypothetical protein
MVIGITGKVMAAVAAMGAIGLTIHNLNALQHIGDSLTTLLK